MNALIVIILFPVTWIACFIFNEWVEKDHKRNKFFAKMFGWDHYY